MTTKQINKDKFAQFIDGLIQSGKVVIAPRKKADKVYFGKVRNFTEIAFEYIQTALSAKSVLFPRVEELIQYKLDDGKTVVESLSPNGDEVVVFGLRPCDAATIGYMADFFLKENADVHFKKRLDQTTFITLSCNKSDDYCFCTSVGLDPGSTKGADMQLTEIAGNYYVEVMTDKGEKLISQNASLFNETGTVDKAPHLANIPKKFELDILTGKIKETFDSPKWIQQSLACLGCGACASACPTCTCFDIQDEGDIESGKRLRCWDTCALGLFTLHASGHNPRSVQSQRWRQRLMHKFDYSNQNLQQVSCVGCGRCARVCPAQMNILENVISLVEA